MVKLTLISILLIMLGYFLLLYSGIAFIQDKRFFSSAPPQVLQVVPDKKKRFKGAHIIGWCLAIIALSLFIGSFLLLGYDSIIRNDTYIIIFVRYIILLYTMELYDIFFFDWVLLCHSNFYPYFYPEVKDIVGPHLFGFNKSVHIRHFILYIPLSLLLAFICVLL